MGRIQMSIMFYSYIDKYFVNYIKIKIKNQKYIQINTKGKLNLNYLDNR